MDWVVGQAADGAKPKAGIVYQQDDYGADGLNGWRAAAKQHGVEIVSEQTVSPGQKDFTAVVAALKDAGADTVLLAVLPSASGPILGTAAQLGYGPTWIGNTPTWVDAYFKPDVIPSVVFGKFNIVTGMPFWGEQVEGMAAFTTAWDTHGAELGNKDSYILMSYLQGLTQIEVTRRAIESKDVTRAGFQKALGTIDGFTAGGLSQPITLNAVPYVAGTRTRIMRPDFEAKSWTVVADWAEPTQAGAVAAPKAAAAK